MKTERLRSILRLLIEWNNKYGVVDLLNNIENAYTQSVQNPDPNNAQAFNDALEALRASAAEYPVSGLSPSRRKILSAISGLDYYGDALIHRLEGIISTSTTPSDTLVGIQKLRSQVNDFFPTVQAIDDNLAKLKIGIEDIPTDSAEIEILIPESMIDGHLKGFVKETQYIETSISDIREVVTGERTPLEIRSLSSGSVELYIYVDPVTGAAVLNFVSAVVLLISNIVQTRRSRESLEQQDAPKSAIKELKSWEEQRIKKEIDKLSNDLIKQYKGEEGRKNELKNALSLSLKRLANRIDRGMDIDVTTAITSESEGDETTEEGKQSRAKKQSIDRIRESGSIISQIERTEEPVVQLDIKDNEEDEEGEKST